MKPKENRDKLAQRTNLDHVVFELLLGRPQQIVKQALGELTFKLGFVDRECPRIRAVKTSAQFAPVVGVPPLVTTMSFPTASHGIPLMCFAA